jgi:serine protease Do
MSKFVLRLVCLAALISTPLYSMAADPVAPSAAIMQAQTMQVAPKCVACTVGLVGITTNGPRVSIESGSGVLVSADGLILTAAHVIMSPGTKLTMRFSDGRVVQGVAVGMDHATDTGLARIVDPPPAGGWPFCEKAPDNSAAPGEWVLATGNPGSIVIDRDPPLRLGRVIAHTNLVVDTNCACEPGDSGGPLFDLQGRVIGINSRIMTGRGDNRPGDRSNDHPGDSVTLHVPIALFNNTWKDLLTGVNANPDVNLDSRYIKPKPIPGISARTRAALNKLAVDKDPEAMQLLADEHKTGKMKLTPAQMERVLKVASKMDHEAARTAGTSPTTAPAKLASASPPPTTQPDASMALKVPTTNPAVARATGLPTLGTMLGNRIYTAAGRTSAQTLSLFTPAVKDAGDCVVRIDDGKDVVLLGSIVDSAGWIVTKASDLPTNPRIVLSDGKVLPAKRIGTDTATDLALLKVDADGLTAVKFSESSTLGEWITAPTGEENQSAIGVVSNIARPIPATFSHFEGEQKLVLGVGFDNGTGRRIISITPGMPAEASGMKIGDEVYELNGKPVSGHDDFVAILKTAKTGDVLSIMVHRDGKDIELKPKIGASRATTQTASSVGEADNVAGGKLSKRRTNFPMAIQTDTATWADQCGGPLINLQGQTVGIVIARYDRVCTFALPATLVEATVAKLKASSTK